jgi:disulfide bond formation protein DsbB
MAFLDPILKRWPLFTVLISGTMLGVALAFQTFGGLMPCHMCLEQRDVYKAAIAIGAITALGLLTPHASLSRKIGGAVLALTFGYGAYLAGFQAGAEWKWWPAPETCATAKASFAGVLALMRGKAAAMPACDQAQWVFLGISMAGWNFVASVILVALSALSIIRPKAEA